MRHPLAIATAAFAFAFAGAAQAHTSLKTANPAPNAIVSAAPKELRLTFSGTVLPRFTTLTVTGPGGAQLHAGPVVADPANKAVVVAPLHGGGAAGAYKVDWSAASGDMHKMTGSYSFTVRP